MSAPPPIVEVSCSDKGAREEQQDACATASRNGAFFAVLCDGAGGHRGGAKASWTAVETAKAIFLDPATSLDSPHDFFSLVVKETHSAIVRLGETPKTAPRSTIAMLLLGKNRADWANVGDSRIYHLREGKIVARSKDHTMVEILLKQGEITEEEMGTHPDQSRLLRSLGADEDPKPSFGSSDLREGDGFLLCSDGLWERIKRREIESVFNSDFQTGKLGQLVTLAVKRNGPKGDNVTALAVQYGKISAKGQPRSLAISVLRGMIWGVLLAALVFFFGLSRCTPTQPRAEQLKTDASEGQ